MYSWQSAKDKNFILSTCKAGTDLLGSQGITYLLMQPGGVTLHKDPVTKCQVQAWTKSFLC